MEQLSWMPEDEQNGAAVEAAIVAVPDHLYAAWDPPRLVVPVGSRIRASYLPSSIVADRGQRVSRCVPDARPSGGRQPICVTWQGELVEQEPTGRIYVNGRLTQPEWLLDFGIPREDGHGRIEIGQPVAMLASSCIADGFLLRIAVSSPLLWVYRPPLTVSRGGLVGWLEMAATHPVPEPGPAQAARPRLSRLADLGRAA